MAGWGSGSNVRGYRMEADTESGEASAGPSPSRLIDARIEALGDWRGPVLARVRALIRQAVPDVVEEWKWRGVPVWSHAGILCTGETYRAAVKLTFARGAELGAELADPAGLFNASLEGTTRRAIDLHEGGALDEAAFVALVRAAAELNRARSSKSRKAAGGAGRRPQAAATASSVPSSQSGTRSRPSSSS